MDLLQTLYNRYCLMVLCLLGSLLIAHRMKTRKFFFIYMPLVVGANIFFTWAYRYFFSNFSNDPSHFLRFSRYLIQYVFCFLIVFCSFKSGIITSIFCATCGYTSQHLIQRAHALLLRLIPGKTPFWLTFFLWILVALIIFVGIFFFFRYSNGKDNKFIKIKNREHVVTGTLGLAVMIFIEGAMTSTVFKIKDSFLVDLNFISSIVFAVIIIILEFNLVSKENYINELIVLKQIEEKDREHFEIEKTMIDTINIKSHDLKHQITSLGNIDSEEKNLINDAIDIYDSNFKTGNKALDVVLTTKNMICKKKKIEFTALINGSKLSFMKDSDVYSLFGNILDNAIEGVENLVDEDKRIISLSMFIKEDIMILRCENYFNNELNIVDGIPQTTKDNKDYHGYGLKSIMMVANKYDADVKIGFNNNIFTLNLMFFLKK